MRNHFWIYIFILRLQNVIFYGKKLQWLKYLESKIPLQSLPFLNIKAKI